MMTDEAHIRAAEAARCAAIAAQDWAAVGALLDSDYVHIHGNGRVTDKAATLARLAANPRAVTRGPLTIRAWGDTALMLGEQANHDGDAVTRAMVSQVLRRRGERWLFASLQFTAIRD